MLALARRRWRAWMAHPILWLELRQLRRWWSVRWVFPIYLLALAALVLLGIGVGGVWLQGLEQETDIPAWVAGSLTVFCPATALGALLRFLLPWVAPAIAAISIAREREMGTWELLRSTALTEREIVLGKLAGVLGRLWPALLAMALLTPFQFVSAMVIQGGNLGIVSTVMVQIESSNGPDLLPVLLIAALQSLVSQLAPWSRLALNAVVGLTASALARSTGAAIALAYGGVIGIRVVLMVVGGLFGAGVLVAGGLLGSLVNALAQPTS
ncbi:MAG: hypothetical protein PVI59_08650, partial [Anaerolineae bacterium]